MQQPWKKEAPLAPKQINLLVVFFFNQTPLLHEGMSNRNSKIIYISTFNNISKCEQNKNYFPCMHHIHMH